MLPTTASPRAPAGREQLSLEACGVTELLIEEGIDLVHRVETAEIDLMHMDFEDGAGESGEAPEDCLGGPRVTQIGDICALAKPRLLAEMHEVKRILRAGPGECAQWHFLIRLTTWRFEVLSDEARRRTGSCDGVRQMSGPIHRLSESHTSIQQPSVSTDGRRFICLHGLAPMSRTVALDGASTAVTQSDVGKNQRRGTGQFYEASMS